MPDIAKIIQKQVNDLNRLANRTLPVKVGRAVVESARQNFRQGGFYGKPWAEPVRRTLGFDGASGRYGPLLSRQNHLMSSTDYIPGQGKVTIQNAAEYARIHNEGGQIPVTVRMKRFFWAKYYETGFVGRPDGGSRGQRSRQTSDVSSAESAFWRGMALKKVGSAIKIPKRQFLGESPQVKKIVEDIINKELQDQINKWNR